MVDPARSGPAEAPGSQSRAEELLRLDIANPSAPRPDEVQRLASEVLCGKTAIADPSAQRKLDEAIRRQSQAFLQTVIDAMPDMMVVIDRDYHVVQANRAAREALAGHDPAGRCFLCYHVLHGRSLPCEGPHLACPLKQVVATKAPATVTHIHHGPQGREIFLDVRASPVRDESGELTHIIELCRDITEQKRFEESLREANRRIVSILESISEGFVSFDRQWRYTYVNEAAARMVQKRPDELLGSVLWNVFPEASRLRFYPEFQRAVAEGTPAHFEEFFPPLNAWYECHCFPSAEGLSVYFQDVTQRKRDAEELRLTQQRLLELQRREKELVEAELNKVRETLVRQTRLATVGQLSASIAHDLRNPLASISYAAHVLREHVAAESEGRQFLAMIEEQVQTADEIIADCMAISRGKPPNKVSVSLSALLAQVRAKLNPPAQIEWRHVFQSDPFLVHADPAQLERVLRNLLANALQALGNAGTITVQARHAGACDEICVGDNGPGIAPEVRDRIFEPLVTTNARGTGLGLAICRQIVERHGGSIELAAADWPGAGFRIRLPAGMPAAGPSAGSRTD